MDIIEAPLSCFVICPIGNKHAELGTEGRDIYEKSIQTFEEIISPACLGVGLRPFRADGINEAGEITDQIFRSLRDAHVVIADLTGANPNVMYELGLRHTTAKLTIQIGESDRLPFDVTTIRTIIFKRTPNGLITARRSLIEALAAGINGKFSQISATRIWLETAAAPILDEEELVDNGIDEPGYLELLADMEAGRADMIATLSAMGNVVTEIGSTTNEATEALAKLGGASASIADKIRISNQLAERIFEPVGRLEALSKALADSIRKSDPGTKFQIERLCSEKSNSNAEILNTLRSLFLTMLNSFSTTADYRKAFVGPQPTKAQGLQYRRIVTALDGQISVRPVVEGWMASIEACAPAA